MKSTQADAAPQSPMIYKQMAKIMAEVGHISKGRSNQQQGYKFRGVDDVYQALQPIMAKHGVIALPEVLSDRSEERQSKNGGVLIYRILTIRYTFYAEDGSSVPAVVVGEGMDSGDKASNKAMSVGDKYALLQAFKIPTEEPKDPENDSHEIVSGGSKSKQPESSTTTSKNSYDNRSTPDRNWLLKEMEARKVNPDQYKAIAEAMVGNPKTGVALDAVIITVAGLAQNGSGLFGTRN